MHNKTPWSIEVDTNETIIEGQAHTVCHGVSNEDAEIIVKAVNNYDDMKSALLNALAVIECYAPNAPERAEIESVLDGLAASTF